MRYSSSVPFALVPFAAVILTLAPTRPVHADAGQIHRSAPAMAKRAANRTARDCSTDAMVIQTEQQANGLDEIDWLAVGLANMTCQAVRDGEVGGHRVRAWFLGLVSMSL